MSSPIYYRGGSSLVPRPVDVIIDPKSGLVSPLRGVSISDRPDGLDRFGGAFQVGDIPPTLRIVKTGRKAHHYEIAPAVPMSFDDYKAELSRIVLTPV